MAELRKLLTTNIDIYNKYIKTPTQAVYGPAFVRRYNLSALKVIHIGFPAIKINSFSFSVLNLC